MSLLKSVESTIANLVEGAFGRLFRSELHPMELARKLAREMDEHRTETVSRVYAPNEYSVWLSPRDRARFQEIEQEVIDELCAYLLEHARRERLVLSSPPHISFHTDERLALGEFGIQAQLLRQVPAGDQPASPGAGPPDPSERRAAVEESPERGSTMIYSGSARMREAVEEAQAQRAPRALLAVGGRRLMLPPRGGTVGRSRDCDIVLEDAGISRRHAEIRPQGDRWSVTDLGSTNGVLLNGREMQGPHELSSGDHLQLGSTEIIFEVG
jgi:hypothetical protein